MTENEINAIKQENEFFIQTILTKKYCHPGENSLDDIKERFKKTIEEVFPDFSDTDFFINQMMFKLFVPGGSILFGFGSKKNISMSNCYYIPIEEDSIDGIGEAIAKNMKVFSWRGGVGNSFEILRPKGSPVNNAAKTSTGSVSFMPLFSNATQTIGQNGRRGASIFTHAIWHPDVIDFIKSKAHPEEVFEKDTLNNTLPKITGANISVKINNDFMEAVKNNESWQFIFPDMNDPNYKTDWNGDITEWKGKIKKYKKIQAKELMKIIAESAWNYAEPGVLFWDNVINNTPMSVVKKLKPRGVNPCFVGDTIIATADGRNGVTIKQLAEENKKFPVYSAKFENNTWNAEVKKAKAFKTGTKKVITLLLLDGSKVNLTPDHLLATNDGGYIEAKDSLGKSLVKFNNNLSEIKVVDIIDENKYEDVYDLTVEDNHNFYIITKTDDEKYLNSCGILVHNCGEEILADYDSCNLGALILYNFVKNPYTPNATFDFELFKKSINLAVEFMDNILDINKHPLPQQQEVNAYGRKIGLGITGLGDALAMLNVRYGSKESLELVEKIMAHKALYETEASIDLSIKKGMCPALKDDEIRLKFATHHYFKNIENKAKELKIETKYENLTDSIFEHGLRNISISTIAPTGTISIITGNSTSGIEPLFSFEYYRNSNLIDQKVRVIHPILFNYLIENNIDDLSLPKDKLMKKYNYVEAHDLDYKQRIDMQSICQKYTTDSISSTVNLPNSTTIDDIMDLYLYAYEKGLKGITVYRDGCSLGGILETNETITKKIGDVNINDIVTKDQIKNDLQARRIKILWKNNIKTNIIVSISDDGRPIEIFAKIPKQAGYEKGNFSQSLFFEKQSYWESLCRLVALSLRNGISLEAIIKELDRSSYSMYDLPAILKRVLLQFTEKDKEENENSNEYTECPECGEKKLSQQGGCAVCLNCGYSKCS